MLNERERHNLRDWLMQVAYTSLRLFVRNELPNHAAATAFYALLAAAPLVLLVSYAAQWLARLAESSNLASILLAAFYEQFHLDQLMAMGIIPSSAQAAVGGIGLLTLLLSARGLVNSVQSAFRVIFPDEAKRRLVISWSLPFIIVPVVFLLAILAVLAQGALGFLAEGDFLGAWGAWALQAISGLIGLAAIWGLFFMAYWRLPLHTPRLKPTLLLALFSALTIAILISGFGLFFSVDRYRAVYGALGGVVFILIGTYFACLVFYYWGQCLYALTKVDVVALEKLFLGGEDNPFERYVFGRGDRLLEKYGRQHGPGDTLIVEGDADLCAYFLHSGQVGLYKNDAGTQKKLGSLAQGQLFGEMAYLLGEKRTATVIAETETVVLVLPPELLEELMRYSAPLSRRIIGTLCQRLQRMNQASAQA